MLGCLQLVTHLDNLCIYHWLFVRIIQLVVATPYTDRNFLFASAEVRIDRFLPIFFLNIPFIHVTRPQNFFWDHSIIFQPQNFNFNFQIFTLRNMWAEIEKCGQNQPNLEMSDSVLVFVRGVIWHQEVYYCYIISQMNTCIIKKILPKMCLALLRACRYL